jgi:Ca2+-binding RTX toxin-like protein
MEGKEQNMRVQANPGLSHAKKVEPVSLYLVVQGTSGNDQIRVTPNKVGGVDVTVTDQNGKTKRYSFNEYQAKHLAIIAGNGNDNVWVDPRVKQDIYIDGGAGNDQIYGGSGNDRIYGGSGNDRLYGGRGNDVIAGGPGVDVLNGGPGRDVIVDATRLERILGNVKP